MTASSMRKNAAAHWIRSALHTPSLSKQRFQDVPVLHLTGNFPVDVQGAIDLQRERIFDSVFMDGGIFVPIRLLENAVPRNVATHRYVDQWTPQYAGIESLRVVEENGKYMVAGEGTLLDESEPLVNGVVVRVKLDTVSQEIREGEHVVKTLRTKVLESVRDLKEKIVSRRS